MSHDLVAKDEDDDETAVIANVLEKGAEEGLPTEEYLEQMIKSL